MKLLTVIIVVCIAVAGLASPLVPCMASRTLHYSGDVGGGVTIHVVVTITDLGNGKTSVTTATSGSYFGTPMCGPSYDSDTVRGSEWDIQSEHEEEDGAEYPCDAEIYISVGPSNSLAGCAQGECDPLRVSWEKKAGGLFGGDDEDVDLPFEEEE